jgi:enoyl-CoA hydratase
VQVKLPVRVPSEGVMVPENKALSVRQSDGVQVWSLNHAPVNGIGPVILSALHEQLAAATTDESVAAVVLTSELRVFSAGADAAWMAEVASAGDDGLLNVFIATMDTFRDLSWRIRTSPFLVIAALGGHALAGGLELAAACDLRFAADDDAIKIGVPEMELFGQMPDGGGGVQFLARLMGPSRALQFVLDAAPVTPRTAYELGLIDRLCSTDLVLEAEKFAASVARKAGRVGVSATKRAVFVGSELQLASALELDRSLHWDCVRRGDFAGTTRKFIERFASRSVQR